MTEILDLGDWAAVERAIVYEVYCLPEDLQLEGNVMQSGDEALDAQAEAEVKAQLAAGNPWAWCVIRVVARIPDVPLEGVDHLGGCSYASQDDFVADAYFEGMKQEAKKDLLRELKALLLRLDELAAKVAKEIQG